jgi:hypothetical protein
LSTFIEKETSTTQTLFPYFYYKFQFESILLRLFFCVTIVVSIVVSIMFYVSIVVIFCVFYCVLCVYCGYVFVFLVVSIVFFYCVLCVYCNMYLYFLWFFYNLSFISILTLISCLSRLRVSDNIFLEGVSNIFLISPSDI